MASISFVAAEPDARDVWTNRLGQRGVWERPQFVVDGTVANVELLDGGRVRVRITMEPPHRCPDCGVLPFSLHEAGCDVARCLRTRAERALAAVSDIANWLGSTEPDAAALAGRRYRRSYYNWSQGTQPYAATTLDLHEAHALLSAMVRTMGVTKTREWLSEMTSGVRRLDLLQTNEGRARLQSESHGVLFVDSQTEPAPAMYDDEDHGPKLATASPDDFGPPILVNVP